MRSFSVQFPIVLTGILLLTTLGCGGASSEELGTVPVSGTIKLDGQTMANTTVYFMSEDFTGSGMTDEEGQFSLTQGARPGTNKVYLTKKMGDGSANPEIAADVGQLEAMDATGKAKPAIDDSFPPKYSDPTQTELTFNVPEEGTSEADFDLAK